MRLDFLKAFTGPKRILMHTLMASFALFTLCLIAVILVQFVFGVGGGYVQPGNGNDPDYIPVLSRHVYSEGSLLVVNTEVPIKVYPENSELVTIQGENKTSSYQVVTIAFQLKEEALNAFNAMLDIYYAETGDGSVTITSAYRTEADQEKLSSSAVQAGYSDHHLALSVALKSNNAELEAGHWIYENGYKYGFIQRYPAGKEDSTLDVQRYYNCVRYVGVPHATYMHDSNLSLEEYVQYVKDYTYDKPLTVSVGNTSYAVYYVPATNLDDTTGLTQIPVPKGIDADAYSYSGNNTDGFIVTVKVS